MEHIGIDLGAAYSHIVILSKNGDKPQRKRVKTEDLPRWLMLLAPSRVVMEACTQSPAVARAALEFKHEVRVVPGNCVRALGVGARGIKTNDRDAEVLARASVRNDELPSSHLRSETSRARRELLTARHNLLESRKSIVLSVKSWLRGRLIYLKGRFSPKNFSATVRELALQSPLGLPRSIEMMLETFDFLTQQIDELTETLKDIADEDPVCKNLQTIPGVGPQVSVAFTALLDDPVRFASADELGSYMALVPGEATTGGKLKRTSTIKAGPQRVKALLVQAAWSMWRSRPNDPVVQWARRIADRRGRRIAIVALARKIATIMWAMWKRGEPYRPSMAAQPVQPPSGTALSSERPVGPTT